MAEKSNFFHHRVMDPKTAPNDYSAADQASSTSGISNDGGSSSNPEEQSKFKPSLRSIVGVGLLMCVIGAFTMNWSGGKGRSHSYMDDEVKSAQDPDYLKIKGRRAENVRSGRGILHSIFCRGNQRSEYCSRH